MESPLLTWVVITFGVLFCFSAFVVESQNVEQLSPPPFSPPPPSPPPPSPPPPSPPPPSPPPPPPPSPPPPPPYPSPPPPLRKQLPLAPPKNGSDHNPHNARGKLSPPPSKEKSLNFGQKIGLLFVGIAAILQVCVGAFLVIKRKQLLRAESRF